MVPASVSLRDGTPAGAAFGEFLRQARERRGLTLQQISNETKIPWRHLDALEHGRLNAVPGGTYRRGEIRAYAEVVGLDQALALERLDRALLAATGTIAAPARSSSSWGDRRIALGVLALIVIAVAAVLGIWDLSRASRSEVAARVEPLRSQPVVPPSAAAIPLPWTASAPVIIERAVAVEATPEAPATVAIGDGLTVTSDPPGARVTVDGIARGITPVTIAHLAPGDRRVRVTMPSFSAAEHVVPVPADGRSATLHVVLGGVRPQ